MQATPHALGDNQQPLYLATSSSLLKHSISPHRQFVGTNHGPHTANEVQCLTLECFDSVPPTHSGIRNIYVVSTDNS